MDLNSTVVSLTRCSGYREESLALSLDALTGSLALPEQLRSLHVLLKPNLITARYGPLACTEGRFILAVARWFLSHGARVSVGDSPAFGNSHSVLKELSLIEPIRKLGVQICDFDKVHVVTLPSGTRAGLAVHALECDLLVSLPRIKAHGQLLVTMGVKNCFGCLVGMRKPLWHMLHGGNCGRFSTLLVEIMGMLPQTLTLMDGIATMHKTGPIKGEPFSMGLLAGAVNPVALDRAMLNVLGIDPRKSPLMNACIKAGLTGVSFDELVFPLEHPKNLQVTDFQVPEQLAPIRFDFSRFVRNSFKRFFLKLKLI
jgi:uncharacterized protein (DUF362 family)